MNIEEIRKEKAALEVELCNRIAAFEKLTGVAVRRIELETAISVATNIGAIVYVQVELQPL